MMTDTTRKIWTVLDDCIVNPPDCINLESLHIKDFTGGFGGLERFVLLSILFIYILYFILINIT